VSVTFATGDPAAVGVTLYLDERALFTVSVVADMPVLEIQHGPTLVRIWPHTTSEITQNDIAAARRLVRATRTYLAELERIHADPDGQSTAG
jgi:hypothetical protein